MTGWFTYSQNTNRTIFPLLHLNFACINHVPSSGACGLLGCLLQRIILHTGLWLTECPSLKAAILNWASAVECNIGTRSSQVLHLVSNDAYTKPNHKHYWAYCQIVLILCKTGQGGKSIISKHYGPQVKLYLTLLQNTQIPRISYVSI